MKNSKVRWMAQVAMLAAAAMILMLAELPLPFIAPSFYQLDFSEVPVLIGTFALGPMAGMAIEAVKILLNFLIDGTITAGVGEAANFLIGISFVLPAGFIYRHKKTKRNAVLGMIIGGIVMVAFSGAVNAWVLVPAYGKAFKMPISAFVDMAAAINPSVDSLWKMVLICVVPFNILKAVLVAAVTTLLYKHISPMLK